LTRADFLRKVAHHSEGSPLHGQTWLAVLLFNIEKTMEIILYSAKGSNSSEKVEWALNYKRTQYQRIEVTNTELKSTYLKINHFGYVPSLKIDNEIITESMAIIELLEEVFPQYPILPDSPIARAKVRQICEYINTTVHSPQNRTAINFFNSSADEFQTKALRARWILQCLQKLADSLWLESPFAIGNKFSAADIFVATTYKKALQLEATPMEAFDSHLKYLRANDNIRITEPYQPEVPYQQGLQSQDGIVTK
jgi:glutathione S-transferase